MLNQYFDASGAAGFELLVAVILIGYIVWQCIRAILERNLRALCWFAGAAVVVGLIRAEGATWPVLLQMFSIILICFLLFKGCAAQDPNNFKQEDVTPEEPHAEKISGNAHGCSSCAQDEKTVTCCPFCQQRVSLPRGKKLYVTCPACLKKFYFRT